MRVIGLPRPRLPRRLLTRQHDGEAIEVGDDAAIDGLVERVQPCLVRQELADGDSLLALLRELRPVGAHTFLVIEPASRVREGERHRGQALGGRVDDHHRVPLPGLAGLLVSDYRPRGRRPSRRGDRHSRRRRAPARRAKLSANASRTPSKSRPTIPSTRCDVVTDMIPPGSARRLSTKPHPLTSPLRQTACLGPLFTSRPWRTSRRPVKRGIREG